VWRPSALETEVPSLRPYSFLSHLECARCGKECDAAVRQQTCRCGSPLLARYDLSMMAASITKSELESREPTLWRYHEWLPLQDPAFRVSFEEHITPIVSVRRLAADMGLESLCVKDESSLPSGTFKARGATVGISRAMELGVSHVAIPTNGNAGAAWALYAARAGIRATVVMPSSAPLTPRKECVLAGADLYVIEGTIADAAAIVDSACRRYGWYDVSTLREPYRLEGKKTFALEIAQQYGWDVPDVLVYPTGGGAGVIGIDKGLRELQAMGWIGEKLPRVMIVQAAGCAPLVRAFDAGEDTSTVWKDPHTLAFGMRVPKALGDFMILDVIRRSKGTAITVADGEIIRERRTTVAREGLHVCPEGAAALAGVRKLREQGQIGKSERVLVINTGSGLKYVDQIEESGIPLNHAL